jgi:cell division protease FtsH|uniref:AAA+ ATPase domain-containing protein n=1 Tax=viral metagenome TaxID=1070528 RepID=A0A6C0DYD3_9ZZZZ
MYYENYLKRLNSKNISIQNQEILGNDDAFEPHGEGDEPPPVENDLQSKFPTGIRIYINQPPPAHYDFDEDRRGPSGDDEHDNDGDYYRKLRMPKSKKSENFEVISKPTVFFRDVGGYDLIKKELLQCVDMLQNYTKYSKFNVRVPKGLILEGPPGNGKTLIAKAFSGEANCSFITVSGSEFQEKYVGVGSARIRELFQLAKKNVPCIIFIDEIDALGRNRGKDGESASAERDNTLNELLVALDGFKNTSGIFVIGATNRADLLDAALTRPGRIDKRIFIGNPDEKTRREIVRIHSRGKPRLPEITDDDLVDLSAGFSCAQIENLLNEAMLNALRYDRYQFSKEDVDTVYNKILVGWQPNEHVFTSDIIDHIAIHEMGHAVMGILSKHHAKVTKIIINLSAPTSPGYTVFESADSNIYKREALLEHLTILLAGRVAEEVFYGISVTTGALNDFEEALKLAHKMIVYYGMGTLMIYPDNSEAYKEMIDTEISELLKQAYIITKHVIEQSKELIMDAAEILKEKRTVLVEEVIELMNTKYSDVFDIEI